MKYPMPLLLLAISLLLPAARAETVTVYTSANFAPLVIDGTRGIYYDAIDYLNQQSTDGTKYRLAYLPRKRLQMRLEDGTSMTSHRRSICGPQPSPLTTSCWCRGPTVPCSSTRRAAWPASRSA
jgi:hypothetical protein